MVSFGHVSLDVRASQCPGCTHTGPHTGLRRRQLFQPNQPQNSGRRDAEGRGAFTDGYLAAGLPFALMVERNRMVVANTAVLTARPSARMALPRRQNPGSA